MTIGAIGSSAPAALSLLNLSGNAAPPAASSTANNTTSVATALDGAVTTTVTSPTGDVVSVAVAKPAASTNQPANPNAVLDIQV